MTKDFFNPSKAISICYECGKVIPPSDCLCHECQMESVDPLDLDPVAITIIVLCTLGIGVITPLAWILFKIVIGR